MSKRLPTPEEGAALVRRVWPFLDSIQRRRLAMIVSAASYLSKKGTEMDIVLAVALLGWSYGKDKGYIGVRTAHRLIESMIAHAPTEES